MEGPIAAKADLKKEAKVVCRFPHHQLSSVQMTPWLPFSSSHTLSSALVPSKPILHGLSPTPLTTGSSKITRCPESRSKLTTSASVELPSAALKGTGSATSAAAPAGSLHGKVVAAGLHGIGRRRMVLPCLE